MLALQITVQMQVDRSRWVCGAVVRGELDVALVGGEVPAEHYEHLQVCCQVTPCGFWLQPGLPTVTQMPSSQAQEKG